jgi:hypothetical protein
LRLAQLPVKVLSRSESEELRFSHASFIVPKPSKGIAAPRMTWGMRVANEKLYRDWIVSGLKKPGKTQKGLAAALGVSESAVSRLLAGHRRIQLVELPRIGAYLQEEIPSPDKHGVTTPNDNHRRGTLGSVSPNGWVAVTTVIAPSVWRKSGAAVAVAERVPASPDIRLSRLKQYACKIEAQPNRYAVCVPYADLRPRPLPNDIVHVRRTNKSGMQEDTLRVVRVEGDRVNLEMHDASSGERALSLPQRRGDTDTIEIVGLVVAFTETVPF